MEKFVRSLRLVLAIGLGTMILSPAEAAQITYTSLPLPVPDNNRPAVQAAALAVENSFLATLSSYGTEKYDSGITTGFSSSQALTFGATGVTGVSQFSGVFTIPSLPNVISTPNALVMQPAATSNPNPYANDFTFSAPVTAFGSYFIQAGDGAANTLTLRLQNTLLGTTKDVVMGTVGPSANFNNVFYFGITDTDPFNKVTVLPSLSGDGILIDNTTVGTVAIPEVGSLTLLAIGSVVPVVLYARRRAKSA
jgi:hypothetical protein